MIYETTGRAREYFELAANLYRGCEHACVYCYGADVTRTNPREFFKRGLPRKNALRDLERDAKRLGARGEKRRILLSFVTDPYQPVEERLQVTRRAIGILQDAGLGVAILTKAGRLAQRDFEILTPRDMFGVTLTLAEPPRSRTWEPGADLPLDRMDALKKAKSLGIQTWVSLEPVIDPAEALALIMATSDYVDHYKVGTMNYADRLPDNLRDQIRRIDWTGFARNAVIMLDRLGKSYYIKKDLAYYLGKSDGITVGQVPK